MIEFFLSNKEDNLETCPTFGLEDKCLLFYYFSYTVCDILLRAGANLGEMLGPALPQCLL